MATQLVNSATGYNWVAKATPVGPMVQQRGGNPWTGAIQGGAFKLAACEVREGKNGLDGVQAQWRQPDGLELRWSVKNVSGVLEFQSEVRNTGAADVNDITMVGPLSLDLSVQTGRPAGSLPESKRIPQSSVLGRRRDLRRELEQPTERRLDRHREHERQRSHVPRRGVGELLESGTETMRERNQAALQSGNGRTCPGESGVAEVGAGLLGR